MTEFVSSSRIEETVDGFRRVLQVEPGYSKRAEGGGVGTMGFRFALIGELGATTLLMRTGWVPGEKMSPRLADHYPCGSHLGLHWISNPYPNGEVPESWTLSGDPCDWLPNPCYFDASYCASDPIVERFIAEGLPAVWDELRKFYDETAARSTLVEAS